VSARALFIMIAGEPHTRWLPNDIARNLHGKSSHELPRRAEEQGEQSEEPLTLETEDARHLPRG
jgi:hypothetical protein